MKNSAIIETLSDEEFEKQAVTIITNTISGAIENHGSCILGLSGGSTPGPIYKKIASNTDINWNAVHVFLVDDRYVPADHDNSNQRLIHETLIDPADVPASNVYLPDTALPIDKCVADYERQLKKLFKNRFSDLVILGMGEDGHTASLFPGDKAAIEEKEKLVLHTITETFAVRDRVTVTIPVLQSAKLALFLLKGTQKKTVLRKMNASSNSLYWPAIALENARFIVL